MRVLGLIPARSGSKGITKKNLRKLAGKPLINYTIQHGLSSKKIDKLVVTTDDKQIMSIAKAAGAEVPFRRPKNLSLNKSRSVDYVKHALNYLKNEQNYEPEIIIILQPTTPVREYSLIDRSVNVLKKSNASSVISVTNTKNHPYLCFNYNKKKFLEPYKKKFQEYYQRQLFPKLYYSTGGIFTFWKSTVLKYDSIYGPRIKPICIKQENSTDIDYLFDLFISEMRIKKWEEYKKKFGKNHESLSV